MQPNYYGEQDCNRRFKIGHGYKYCLCHYHQTRRFWATKNRLRNGIEPRQRKKTAKRQSRKDNYGDPCSA